MEKTKGGLALLDEPDEPLGAYLRSVLTREGLLGDGSLGLVLPRLTGPVICQVYGGVCVDGAARAALGHLLARRRVWCPWEGLEELGTGPLGRLTRERLWTLRRSGLVLCPLGQLARLAAQEAERGSGYGVGTGSRLGVVYPKIRRDVGL